MTTAIRTVRATGVMIIQKKEIPVMTVKTHVVATRMMTACPDAFDKMAIHSSDDDN